MRTNSLAVGWLLLGMGAVLSVLGFLSVAGVLSVSIHAFGVPVETPAERTLWSVGWLLAALLGGGVLRLARSMPEARRGSVA